jgi:hypothetical protein
MQNRKQWLLGVAMTCLAAGAHAQGKPEDMKRGQELMQQQMMLMTPELAQKAQALSPEIKKFLMHVALRHERRSDTLTLVQVMQEIMAEHQMIGAAIATDNGPMAADAARRIALAIGRAELAPGLVHQHHDAIAVDQRDVGCRAVDQALGGEEHAEPSRRIRRCL